MTGMTDVNGTELEVLEASGLVLCQDAGRSGLAHLGVPRGGWLDAAAATAGNRLVGNPPGHAVLEIALGGLRVRLDAGRWIAVTGAAGPVRIDGRAVGIGRAVWAPAGAEVEVGPPLDGVRRYFAVGGGVDVEPVLGSRSTDTLAWLGPPRVEAGQRLPVGAAPGPPSSEEIAHSRRPATLALDVGPRLDWLADDAWSVLTGSAWTVLPASNRVGLRLDGASVARAPERRGSELASEGLVLGAVQIPPDGRPVVFLADHPTTGGYPVVAVVTASTVGACAQLAPGDVVRFVSEPQRGAAQGVARYSTLDS